MHDLMMILADTMPEEMILKQMSIAIEEYKANPTKETRSKASMYCVLFSSKEAIDTIPGGIDTVLERMDKAKKGFDLMNIDTKNTHS